MRLQYRLVNVFTCGGGRMTGNPLCVIEDATGLTEAQMQALALQFNLSETSFVLPSVQADARVRIFTPGYEMPFAGHPTLGTAHVLRSLGGLGDALSLELNVGPVIVRADGDLLELAAREPETRAPRASRTELAPALGLALADMADAPLWVDTGSEQLVVPLTGPESVRRARPSFEALARVTEDGPRTQAYVFAEDGSGPVVARFFFTKGSSLLEDPATGSAAANLGGWYLARMKELPLERVISQGQETGRPSRLRLRVDGQGSIRVAGEVIELGRGYVEV